MSTSKGREKGKKSRSRLTLLLVLLGILAIANLWMKVTEEPPRQSVRAPDRPPTATAQGGRSIERQFSAWDGSHRQLTRRIKARLHDPSSYKHVETTYGVSGDVLLINTRFRATNALGGLVLQSVGASASVSGDGSDVRILEWN